ncbi:MAG: hypothetical protein F6J87_23290 [Spirulina sp. SIO3F2]|nr:hypothetical protein [Spirulina sp. SIO3F2]
MKLNRKQSRRWLKWGLACLLVLGIFFRFLNLDRKIYWHDEVVTSLRIAGYTGSELIAENFTGQVRSVSDLQKYQQFTPEKKLKDLIRSLAIEDPQHPPLYYIIARFWAQLFGSSVAVNRALVALMSLLIFPGLYWLSMELWSSPRVGYFAMALISVSPIHILYAQEARQYTLGLVMTVFSTVALLRAMRRQTFASWVVYIASVIFGFYTFLFSALVTIGHGLYVGLLENLRWTKTVRAYLISAIVSSLCCLPWVLVVVFNWSAFKAGSSWTTEPISLSDLVGSWLFNSSAIFIDFGIPWNPLYRQIVFPITLILITYTIYYLRRYTPRHVWLLIVLLTTITPLFLIVPDIISGGQRSVSTRYLMPYYLGVQLAISILLSDKFSQKGNTSRIWQGITVGILIFGIISCTVSAQAQVWWHRIVGLNNLQIAQIVNQTEQPLLISPFRGSNTANILALSYLLDPKVKFQLVLDPNIPKIPVGFSDVFLFHPSEGLQIGIEDNYQAEIESVLGSSLLTVEVPEQDK